MGSVHDKNCYLSMSQSRLDFLGWVAAKRKLGTMLGFVPHRQPTICFLSCTEKKLNKNKMTRIRITIFKTGSCLRSYQIKTKKFFPFFYYLT